MLLTNQKNINYEIYIQSGRKPPLPFLLAQRYLTIQVLLKEK